LSKISIYQCKELSDILCFKVEGLDITCGVSCHLPFLFFSHYPPALVLLYDGKEINEQQQQQSRARKQEWLRNSESWIMPLSHQQQQLMEMERLLQVLAPFP
jgi:hypothetical protein